MTELEQALSDFRSQMLAKFQVRAERHPGRSVTEVGRRLLDEDGVYEGLWQHFEEEVQEMRDADHINEEMKEAVDVANMAFLIWWRDRGV